MSKNLPTTERVRSILAEPAVKASFQNILGKRSAAFMSSIISAVAGNKQLEKCEPNSIVASAGIAATMDLPINPSLGLAHIVPYKGVAQFQIGWKGYVQLALRSGQYKTIHATPVWEGQIKKINQFTGEVEFNEGAEPGKEQVGYLLYFKLLNGYEKYFYMSAGECDDHGKRYSSAYKSGFGPWVDNFEAMALKTVVKLGLSKYGILSLEMQKALDVDSPVSRMVEELQDSADNETVVRQLNDVAVDTVQNPEAESQEQFGTLVSPSPGEVLVKLSKDSKPAKIKDIPQETLIKFVSWAYGETKINQTTKVYVANIEAYLGEEKHVEA